MNDKERYKLPGGIQSGLFTALLFSTMVPVAVVYATAEPSNIMIATVWTTSLCVLLVWYIVIIQIIEHVVQYLERTVQNKAFEPAPV